MSVCNIYVVSALYLILIPFLFRYCAISIFESLQEDYCKEGQDFFSQFDLIAGTSVGGIYSYFISLYNGKGCNTQGVVLHGRDMMDHVTENSLRKLSPINLLCCDDMIQEGTQVKDVLKEFYDIPLLQPHCIPTMTLISAIKDGDEYSAEEEWIGDIDKRDLEPLIARTYEYPTQPESLRKIKPLAYSTSGMKMYEAMAATGAAPLLVDRVRAEVDGKMRSMADGGIFQNCPLSLAIAEAHRLYPGRPIGVIVNVGYNDYEDRFIQQTVETTRLLHHNLHFHRIAPNEIMKDFSALETDPHNIARMEAKVKDWLVNNPHVRNMTNATLARLFQSAPRSFGSNARKVDAAEVRQSLMKQSVRYADRCKIRSSAQERVDWYSKLSNWAGQSITGLKFRASSVLTKEKDEMDGQSLETNPQSNSYKRYDSNLSEDTFYSRTQQFLEKYSESFGC